LQLVELCCVLCPVLPRTALHTCCCSHSNTPAATCDTLSPLVTPHHLLAAPAALVAANPGLAKLLFALVFPVGLTMNTLHGTELFTGNTMKLPAAIYEGKTNMGGLIKNWFWSYSGALRGLA
jgi:hypothetical protein